MKTSGFDVFSGNPHSLITSIPLPRNCMFTENSAQFLSKFLLPVWVFKSICWKICKSVFFSETSSPMSFQFYLILHSSNDCAWLQKVFVKPPVSPKHHFKMFLSKVQQLNFTEGDSRFAIVSVLGNHSDEWHVEMQNLSPRVLWLLRTITSSWWHSPPC